MIPRYCPQSGGANRLPRISNIRLRNWKNFGDAATALTERTFLIGPNASGKSNLLDAFRFLRDLANDGLDAAVNRRGGVSALRCLSARRYSDIDVAVTLVDDSGADAWLYCIQSRTTDNVQLSERKASRI